jgi:3-phenylpropionate/trans-cinnamate dioxygenase ferredoxin subunit
MAEEAAVGEWVKVAGLDRCPPGNLLGVVVGKTQIVLANVDGDVYALEDRCSHQDFPLSDGELEDNQLECIYHGAKFDVCTGRATQLPAIRPVTSFAVEVRDQEIFVQI